MKLILSRKGVDSAAGGCASPIVDGVPISLPIPMPARSLVTYGELGFGALIAAASRNRLGPDDLCHRDPVFQENGRAALGQCGAAQSHLANQGVGVGDVFLFFGRFADGRDVHHRIFGFLFIESIHPVGPAPDPSVNPPGLAEVHPHCVGRWPNNNTIYVGQGRQARHAPSTLRLSAAGEPRMSVWAVPSWLAAAGLTFHRSPHAWLPGGRLRSVSQGQEFVARVETPEARAWVDGIVAAIER